MKKITAFLFTLLTPFIAFGADSLVSQSLQLFDYPQYSGTPDPQHIRFGFYSNPEKLSKSFDLQEHGLIKTGYKIWHVLPYSSAHRAGLKPGDVVFALDGLPLKNDLASGDDYMDIYLYDKEPNSFVTLKILRDGNYLDVPVKLIPLETVKTKTPQAPFEAVEKKSWLRGILDESKLGGRLDTINMKMTKLPDYNFSRVSFSDKPNPWQTDAWTYLCRQPTHVGAYSRAIKNDIWRGWNEGRLGGILDMTAKHTPVEKPNPRRVNKPESIEELNEYLAAVQSALDSAYRNMPGGSPATAVSALERLVDLKGGFFSESYVKKVFSEAAKFDLKLAIEAAKLLCELVDKNWAAEFADQAKGKKTSSGKKYDVEGEILARWKSPAGECVIGGDGYNIYRGDFALIIDVGGADLYDFYEPRPGSFRLTLDLDGDDVYRGDRRSQGAGVGGAEVLADFAGDDVYRAESYSQGSGLLGVGVLYDESGDDFYSSSWASQGAGFLGIGILLDVDGKDRYDARAYSQAFGYVGGFGALLDAAGNDIYRAGWKKIDDRDQPHRAHLSMAQGFGYGYRPWTTGISAHGGIGLLSDAAGDDVYNADYFAQGGGYWQGVGILHDGEGSDRYTAGQYSQGSGIHLSFGALLDDSGDDLYDAYSRHQQGAAHDYSAGCLEDLDGKDTYRGYELSQGSAFYVSFAYLLDASGDDLYICKESDKELSQAGANWVEMRKAGGLGIIADFGKGDDFYTDNRAKAGEYILKSKIGILFDDGERIKNIIK